MQTAITIAPTNALAQTGFDPSILAGQVRPSTIAMYQKAWKDYTAFAGDWQTATQPETLARWRTVLANSDKSPNTINRMLSSVRAVMKEAEAQGYLTPGTAEQFDHVRGVKIAAMRDKLKADARTRITPEDMRRLCDAPDVNTLAGKMHRALLLTMASSGLRISEVITLTPGQIKEKRQGKKTGYLVYVVGKTDTEAREAPISVEAYEAIQAWLAARPVASGWIFTGFTGRGDRDPQTTHISAVGAWKLVKRYAQACGLAGIKPHDFRRFVGTTLAKRDPRQAQKALGHKDINTTYRHYVLDELEVGLTDSLF
jgi:integrase/recombinase XerD